MAHWRDFSWTGFLLALITCAVLAITGLDLTIVFSVLLVWIGSLWLAIARPPQSQSSTPSPGFDLRTMREMFDLSGSPLLMTNNGKIEIANVEARRLLGAHIIGQDARVAFRNPEAVALLTSDTGGTAMVHGLVRRRDIWRVGRQIINQRLAVIELIDRTAETDISRAHSDFVANASHELRTPLASIIGYIETMSEDSAVMPPETRTKFLGTILREAKRMQSLVSDLMSLSRVEAEKHDLPDTPIALNHIVEQAARDAAGHKDVERLKFYFQDNFAIAGDVQQIEQLVRNLVENALRYGSAIEPVTVKLDAAASGQARLTVSDLGEGIAPEHLPHLTRRFYRTDPGRSLASGGTGLGLAIVKHIVERHRGRMNIESEPGKGTSVIVRFPAIDGNPK